VPERRPETETGAALCPQPTISRIENLPTPATDPAVVRGSPATTAHLTRNNTPAPTPTNPTDQVPDRQERPMQNQGEDQPCAPETVKAANTASGSKTGRS